MMNRLLLFLDVLCVFHFSISIAKAGELPDCFEAHKRCRKIARHKWGGHLFDNKCYYQTVVSGGHDWSNAMLACKKENPEGRLAAISSIEVAGIILKRFKENHDPYAAKTCMDARDNQCSWWWINGFISNLQDKITNGTNLTLADFKIMNNLNDADKSGISVANTYLNSTSDYFVSDKILQDNPGIDFMCMYLNISKNNVHGYPTPCGMINNAWGICEMPMKCKSPEEMYDWTIICDKGYDPIAGKCYKFVAIPHNFTWVLKETCDGEELATFTSAEEKNKFLYYWKQKYAFAQYIWIGDELGTASSGMLSFGWPDSPFENMSPLDALESLCVIADWEKDSLKMHPCSALTNVTRGSGHVPHYAFCQSYRVRTANKMDYYARVAKLIKQHVRARGYASNLLPIKDKSSTMRVTVRWELNDIKLVEDRQMMTLSGRLIMNWRDEYITWNASNPKYGGITEFRRHPYWIWKPFLPPQDFMLGSRHSWFGGRSADNFPLRIQHDGTIEWMIIIDTTVQAPVIGTFDVLTAFPHDFHHVILDVFDPRYYGSQLTLELDNLPSIPFAVSMLCANVNTSKFQVSGNFWAAAASLCHGLRGPPDANRFTISFAVLFCRVFPLFGYTYWPACTLLTILTFLSLLIASDMVAVLITSMSVMLWLTLHYVIDPMLPTNDAPSLLIFYNFGLIATSICFLINTVTLAGSSDKPLSVIPRFSAQKLNFCESILGARVSNILNFVGCGSLGGLIRRITFLLLLLIYVILIALRQCGII